MVILLSKTTMFLKYTKNITKKERKNMLNDEICKLRNKLNESIVNNKDYDYILHLSVKLDKLIAKHYEQAKDKVGGIK